MKFSEDRKDEVIRCTLEIQQHMMKNMNERDSWRILIKKYDSHIIDMALDMIKFAKTDDRSPYKKIGETIERCMRQLSNKDSDAIVDVKSFYTASEQAYKIFMNDKLGRGMPIVFLYNKGIKGIAIAPIPQNNTTKSPMNFVKEIVFNASPDAYCFCAEASSLKATETEGFDPMNSQYGELIDHKNSKDCVVMMGNNKENTLKMSKIFMITGKTGKLKFKERPDGFKMRSNKLV